MHFHPGTTLAEKLQELGMSVKEFAIRAKEPEKTINAILSGESPITSDMALAFESVTDIPAHFWLNKQTAYSEFAVKLEDLPRCAGRREAGKVISFAKLRNFCASRNYIFTALT